MILNRPWSGGMTDTNHVMLRVDEFSKLSDDMTKMFANKSPVVSTTHFTSSGTTKIENSAGHVSYFDMSYINELEQLKITELYLSNVPVPGQVWHGGYIFARSEHGLPVIGKLGYTRVKWYVIAPLVYDTVDESRL